MDTGEQLQSGLVLCSAAVVGDTVVGYATLRNKGSTFEAAGLEVWPTQYVCKFFQLS